MEGSAKRFVLMSHFLKCGLYFFQIKASLLLNDLKTNRILGKKKIRTSTGTVCCPESSGQHSISRHLLLHSILQDLEWQIAQGGKHANCKGLSIRQSAILQKTPRVWQGLSRMGRRNVPYFRDYVNFFRGKHPTFRQQGGQVNGKHVRDSEGLQAWSMILERSKCQNVATWGHRQLHSRTVRVRCQSLTSWS